MKQSTIDSIPFIKFIPGIAWFFVVLTLICLPKSEIPVTNDWLEKICFDKWIHLGMFAILAFLFMAPVGRHPFYATKKQRIFLRLLLATMGWGLATECIQLGIPGRSFDWLDWAADSMGAWIAYLACRKRYLFRG